VNGKSGGRRGAALMELLANRDDINAVEIVDLTAEGPTASLRRHVGVVPDLRVLVCGGDGTVAWVLQAMEELGEVRREDVGPNLGPFNRVSHALLLPLRLSDADQKNIIFSSDPHAVPPPSTSFKTLQKRPSQDPRSAFSR
jgi:hypothetical protein